MRWSNLVIGEVNTDLGTVVAVDVPAYGFAIGKETGSDDFVAIGIFDQLAGCITGRFATFTNRKCQLVCFLFVARIEVNIVSY